MLFEKFGEFDSYEEINRAAAAQLKEGDTEAIYAIAAENGIDKYDAEDFIAGDYPELTTPLTAALGKIEIEAADLKPYEIMEDWIMYIKVRCNEDEKMALAVRRKGKCLKGCIGELLKWSFHNAKDVDKDVLKASGIKAPRVTLGIPGMATAKRLITEYYMGGEGR